MTTSAEPEGAERQQIATPPLKNVQYLNTPISLSEKDAEGYREISFIVGPLEQHTYTLLPGAQEQLLKILSGGIEIAKPGDVPPAPAGS